MPENTASPTSPTPSTPAAVRPGQERFVIADDEIGLGAVDAIADEVERTLYDGVKDVPDMIRAMRAGEIVNLIEDTSDQAQRVAKTVQSILLKNA